MTSQDRPPLPHLTFSLAVALALGVSTMAASAPVTSPSPSAPEPAGPAEESQRSPPDGLQDAGLQARWRAALAHETDNRFREAAAAFEALVRDAPEVSYLYWKVARNIWRTGEATNFDDKQRRLRYFEQARDWAARGLETDPSCAPCMLWKAGAMARIATTRGVLNVMGSAAEMAALIEDGIALRPTFRDNANNGTLGNLYYAGSAFYRVVPEWLVLKWMIGVRGDLDRSLELIRAAVANTPARIDYRIELGATLLCRADRRQDAAARSEGKQVLTHAAGLPHVLNTDEIDVKHAAMLLESPDAACGYSRDGWVDVGEE